MPRARTYGTNKWRSLKGDRGECGVDGPIWCLKVWKWHEELECGERMVVSRVGCGGLMVAWGHEACSPLGDKVSRGTLETVRDASQRWESGNVLLEVNTH